MATSRIEKAGTIFGRVTGLMRAGAMKWENRPLWYDIYAAFPPLEEPRRDPPPGPAPPPPRTLYYPEDFVRSRFYKEFGLMGIVNLKREDQPSACQRFVNHFYNEASLAKNAGAELGEEEIFKRATVAFQRETMAAKDARDIASKKALEKRESDLVDSQDKDPSSL